MPHRLFHAFTDHPRRNSRRCGCRRSILGQAVRLWVRELRMPVQEFTNYQTKKRNSWNPSRTAMWTALLSAGLAEHKTGFEAFTSYIKKILIGAAILLGGYLAIPIFVAKRTARQCSQTEAIKHQTRAPFPVKPPSREKS